MYREKNIQATTIAIEDTKGQIAISAVYCPPKYNNTKEQYLHYLKSLGNRYLAGGDYNAKNILWGSWLTNKKGRQLIEAIRKYNSRFISTGEPTYWPTDTKKQPDLIDFCIIKNMPYENLTIKSCLELSSDHSPLIMTLLGPIEIKQSLGLYNSRTN